MSRHSFDGLVIDTGPDPDRTVIWLHGLGADGHDFEPIVPELRMPRQPGTRFMFPHAPHRPITLNGGMVMRGWYDVSGLEFVRDEDAEGIGDSANRVRALMEVENERGVPDERIVLAGFSQGGAIALHTGVRHPRSVAGMLALSTYLPFMDRLAADMSAASRPVPILMAHGTFDPLVPLFLAQASRQRLQQAGYMVEFREYPIQHNVSREEIADIGRWLRARLIDTAPAG